MSTSPPKWFMSPEIVLFELYTGNKHPTQNTTSRGFWGGGACKTNKQKVVISYGWMPRRTNSRPSLHTRSKSVQDKCLKGCNVLATEKQTKHIFAAFARTHGTISPHFVRVRTVVPHLYSRFHPNMFRFGEVITKNVSWTPKWFQYRLFEPVITVKCRATDYNLSTG